MLKKHISFALFATCVGTFISSGVHAQTTEPEKYFYTQQKWIATPVPGQDKTCTLSNQFNNGFILKLVGNANGFSNVNIDFRQKSFSANQSYTTELSIPGVVSESFPASAFKENLLVIDIRKSKDFATKLKTSSVLDVTLQSNNFRLYLTGLPNAINNYETCVGISSSETKTTENNVEPTLPDIVVDDSLAPPPPMEKTIEAKNETAFAQDPYEHSVEASRTYLEKKLNNNQLSYTQQLAQETNAQEIKPALQERPNKVQTDAPIINDPTQNTEKTEINAQNMPDLSIAADTPAEQKPETVNTVQKQTIPAVKVTKNEMPSMEVDLTKAGVPEQNNSSLKPAPQKSNEPSADYTQMRDKIAELENMISSLKKENTELTGELKSVLSDSKQEQVSVSNENWDLERATMRYNEAELQVKKLGRQLQAQKTQCDMEKKELEATLFDPRLTEQQQLAKLSSLESALEKAKEDLITQQRTYEERIRLLEKQAGSH